MSSRSSQLSNREYQKISSASRMETQVLPSPRENSITKSTPSHFKSASLISSIGSVARLSTDKVLFSTMDKRYQKISYNDLGKNKKKSSYKLDAANLILSRIIKFIQKHFNIWKLAVHHMDIIEKARRSKKSLLFSVNISRDLQNSRYITLDKSSIDRSIINIPEKTRKSKKSLQFSINISSDLQETRHVTLERSSVERSIWRNRSERNSIERNIIERKSIEKNSIERNLLERKSIERKSAAEQKSKPNFHECEYKSLSINSGAMSIDDLRYNPPKHKGGILRIEDLGSRLGENKGKSINIMSTAETMRGNEEERIGVPGKIVKQSRVKAFSDYRNGERGGFKKAFSDLNRRKAAETIGSAIKNQGLRRLAQVFKQFISCYISKLYIEKFMEIIHFERKFKFKELVGTMRLASKLIKGIRNRKMKINS